MQASSHPISGHTDLDSTWEMLWPRSRATRRSEQTSSWLDFLSRSRVDSFIHEREKKSEERVYKVFARGRRGKLEAGKVRTALQTSGSFPSCRAYQAERVCIFGAVSPLTLSPADVNGTLIAVALFFSFCRVRVFFVLFRGFFGLPFWSLESFTNPR